MADNKTIARMLQALSTNLVNEVETHRAGSWENPETIRLYECLQAAICKTQHEFCESGSDDSMRDPVIDPNKLLKEKD